MRTACLRVSARFRSKEISHELNELNELNSLNSFNSWLIFLSATLPQERPEAHSAESLCAIALRSRMTESPGRSTELCFADHRILAHRRSFRSFSDVRQEYCARQSTRLTAV